MIFQSHRTNKYELDQKSSLLTSSPKLLTLFFYYVIYRSNNVQ